MQEYPALQLEIMVLKSIMSHLKGQIDLDVLVRSIVYCLITMAWVYNKKVINLIYIVKYLVLVYKYGGYVLTLEPAFFTI